MRLIVYKTSDFDMDHWLQIVLEGLPQGLSTVVLTDISALTNHLIRSVGDSVVLLITADSGSDLTELETVIDLLLRFPLVIALGDDRDEALTKAHLFHPRLVVNPLDDPAVTAEVAAKLFQLNRSVREGRIRMIKETPKRRRIPKRSDRAH